MMARVLAAPPPAFPIDEAALPELEATADDEASAPLNVLENASILLLKSPSPKNRFATPAPLLLPNIRSMAPEFSSAFLLTSSIMERSFCFTSSSAMASIISRSASAICFVSLSVRALVSLKSFFHRLLLSIKSASSSDSSLSLFAMAPCCISAGNRAISFS